MNSIKVNYIQNGVEKEVIFDNISISKARRLKKKYLRADDNLQIDLVELVLITQVNNFLKREFYHSLHRQ